MQNDTVNFPIEACSKFTGQILQLSVTSEKLPGFYSPARRHIYPTRILDRDFYTPCVRVTRYTLSCYLEDRASLNLMYTKNYVAQLLLFNLFSEGWKLETKITLVAVSSSV